MTSIVSRMIVGVPASVDVGAGLSARAGEAAIKDGSANDPSRGRCEHMINSSRLGWNICGNLRWYVII
jgi:hypothetical protein